MAIQFKEVSHTYRGVRRKDIHKALDNINLNIDAKNEFIAIVGKTGSGKSTMMQHMNALKLPTSGNVLIFDKVITPKERKNPKLKDVRKKVGFVFQFPEYQLFEENVLKDIMFAPRNFGMSQDDAKQKAIEIAKSLNIENLLNKSPFNLSGGQMRKVAIAGILAYDPEILLLDEPTRGLDPKGQDEIMDLFYSIHKETNKTIVMISHDMDLVYKYATRIIVMNDSKIVYDGDKIKLFEDDIYSNYNLEKPEVLKLIDYINQNSKLNIGYDTFTLDSLLEKLEGSDIDE